jgi:GNAT superfamily N-acetyltransferase
MSDLDVLELRARYDAELRTRVPDPLPEGVTAEWDGPLLRMLGLDRYGFMTHSNLSGLSEAELDALITRQRALFTARGESVEWKLYGHDKPADLPDRLRAAGFMPEERETVVIGPVASLAALTPPLPDGVRLREVTSRADLERIAEMEEAVWGSSRGWLADGLEKELAADPEGLTVVVAEAAVEDGCRVVSAGWVRYESCTAFASLWGGSTLGEWRRKGIYRALVAYRARLAEARGYSLLQVDASDDSRPILERLGLVAVTTTTPYIFMP